MRSLTSCLLARGDCSHARLYGLGVLSDASDPKGLASLGRLGVRGDVVPCASSRSARPEVLEAGLLPATAVPASELTPAVRTEPSSSDDAAPASEFPPVERAAPSSLRGDPG